MSFDLKIQNFCDHKMNWEAGTLDTDRRRITLNYPVASVKSVSLRVDNSDVDSSEYQVLTSSTEITQTQVNYIFLNERVKSFNPFIETTYNTFSNYCPKCVEVKYLDDMIYNQNGDFVQATNEYLLVQLVEKYIVTAVGSNTFHPWLGTSLQSLIGTKIFDFGLLKTKIIAEINKTINNLKSIQTKVIALGKPMTQGEIFDKLLSVDVSQNTNDPTIILILVTFTAKSGRNLEYSQYMELNPFVLQNTKR